MHKETWSLDDTAQKLRRVRVSALLAGALLVLGGSAIALWLPLGAAGAVSLCVLMRLCWLDDNIRSDLMTAEQIPHGYRQTQRLQAQWRRFVFGHASDPVDCPRRLASEMRLQVHALHAFLAGAASGLLVRAFEQPGLALVVGAGVLIGGLLRVDRLVEAEAAMARDSVLSREMLEDRGPIARFVTHR